MVVLLPRSETVTSSASMRTMAVLKFWWMPRNLRLRVPATADLSKNEEGTGRELFKAFRNLAGRADQGASIFEVA